MAPALNQALGGRTRRLSNSHASTAAPSSSAGRRRGARGLSCPRLPSSRSVLARSRNVLARAGNTGPQDLYDLGGDGAPQAPAQGADRYQIEAFWHQLIQCCGHLEERDLAPMRDALQVAYGAHRGQKRKSGEPYIVHPVAVACILAELRMDADSIVAGLLHDVVEDTEACSFACIESIFGKDVRTIVEGETKTSKLKGTEAAPNGQAAVEGDKNALDLQQLFISMVNEIRIIIVKLADRLHNMRTLRHMPKHKQKKIANETLTIFVPLARVLGLYNIKEELEDLSFKYSQPEEYDYLMKRVKQLKFDQSPVLVSARQALMQCIEDDAYVARSARKVEVKIGFKSLYSLHRKLERDGVHLGDIQNIAQLHVVAHAREGCQEGERALCYHLLGKVHEIWAPIPGKFKDYVATPKYNNYQAIHTNVIPLGSNSLFPVEVQIRSGTMEHIAREGCLAQMKLAKQEPAHEGNGARPLTNGNGAQSSHGNGASADHAASLGHPGGNGNGAGKLITQEQLGQFSWINSVREWQREFSGSVSAQEFVATIVGDFLPAGKIFVFTPEGTVVSLPRGATIVDFAYQVYNDEVGHQMIMAKVNGFPTHPSHELRLAEVVEVVTHKGPPTQDILKRQKDYLVYAKTRSTRHKIVKFLKRHAHLLASANVDRRALKTTLKKNYTDADLAEIFASPYDRAEIFWLILKSRDQVGLLADVASIISSLGLSIRAYSGSRNQLDHLVHMNFEIYGKASGEKLTVLSDKLGQCRQVNTFAMGCNLSPNLQNGSMDSLG